MVNKFEPQSATTQMTTIQTSFKKTVFKSWGNAPQLLIYISYYNGAAVQPQPACRIERLNLIEPGKKVSKIKSCIYSIM